MQALDFVFLRETLTNLPKELNLWERHDIGEQEFMSEQFHNTSALLKFETDDDTIFCRYQHRIMGTERPEPWEIRGGLIADEMGLGKTIIMLANIVGSLKRAQVFVSPELQQPGLSSGRKRSKATLVVVPSSSMWQSMHSKVYHRLDR